MKNRSAIGGVFLAAFLVWAAGSPVVAADAELEGPIVQIDPEVEGQQSGQRATEPRIRVIEEDVYWIGIRGRRIASPVLRTHLQLAEDMGVVVADVMPDSPADQAGLRQHDIILRVDGDAVDNMAVLQRQVQAGKGQPMKLNIIRLGQPTEIVVTPELRPQSPELPGPFAPESGEEMRALLDRLLSGQGHPQRLLGPGLLGHRQSLDLGAFDLRALPAGTSISLERHQDAPPQVTIKQGDKTWKVQGDDEQALQQLPDDVRPLVAHLLARPDDPHAGAQHPLDLQRAWPERWQGRNPALAEPWSDRIQELERKLQDLQQRMEAEAP